MKPQRRQTNTNFLERNSSAANLQIDGTDGLNPSIAIPGVGYGLLNSFLEALPDPCLVIDGAGRVVAANRAWRALPRRLEANAAATDPIGIDYLSLFRSSTADESVSQALAGIEAVIAGERTHTEHEYLRPTPYAFRWFRMSVHAWREMGNLAIIFHRDISSEKLGAPEALPVEQGFRALADSAPVMIWMSGPNKSCIFVNRKWLEFTGGRLEDQLGSGWVRLVHPEDRDGLAAVFHDAFEKRQEFAHEYRLRHRDGEYRWVRDSGSPRYDTQNQFMGFTGSVWDLSEQKQVADQVRKASEYARLVQDVAEIANTATTMREALQRSLNTICETMGFPGGHALLIYDDEPGLAKSAHIVYNKDPERFAKLAEISARLTWPDALGAPGEVLRSAKPFFGNVVNEMKYPERYPRAQACFDAGLRGSALLPVLVDGKVEAIIEFGTEEVIVGDNDDTRALIAASERLSRFFERRRAQINFLTQKEELQASAARLFDMAGRLVDSQEEERRRIAREIHDDFTQRLALVSMKIGNLAGRERITASAELDADLEDVRKTTAAVANDLRELSHQLHPAMLEILGLVGALRAQCEDIQLARGIKTEFEAAVSDQDASPQAAMCLYRVLQESLSNVAKHSGSTTAHVSLARKADILEMRVRDEGRGLEPDSERRKGIGFTSMEERISLLNGKLMVNTKPGVGTEIVVMIPAAPPSQQRSA